ncbi:N-acetyl-gamma-glutamyl-phosphate reductase, common form [Owenweeksia hongkongensis DSM 17368]|uniref:N-acetyl-gamma-glutamyl-phosphate reductase n=1 Tax=Owenweeksia hongkongensis (strain DSM 17368 / CIP 108786 / JCM 12287 / NRRL B-23963 / UST20020801) TaxID=926562 RepID=G8R6I8_OWEHD|nr:N-acetyl-gamma-glutamyl-phosphate reductase [Owenweeksia hongkongensis]AEV34451.1 N-acetyl-gamma-glutamyl-phosphate reductase, common form [Owenweeksia hongkongensis DSM 17368]
MIKAGIIGGTGYVAGELIRLLVNHPNVKIDFIYSHSQPGQSVASVHEDLFGFESLQFTDQVNLNVDVLFLCLGHGNSKKFLENHTFSPSTKVIDLSNDFRLEADANFLGKEYVYGLPELNKEKIANAGYIANPGCFATAIQLALLPLAKGGFLKNEVHINAITGSTGAGQSPSATTHFSWRNNNLSIYKAFSHQHLGEIGESLVSLQPDFDKALNFLPLRGDFTRGIFACVYTNCELSEEELSALYKSYYEDAPFTKISANGINLKQVVNTNFCLLQVQKIDGKVLIISVIDNLLKGASGQAIQNMNLMFGLNESTGLNLKASYF